jgi:hypothetical protein
MSRSSPGSRSSSVDPAISASLFECRVALLESLSAGTSVRALQAPVAAFALLARHQGVPPERVVALFKEMVNNILATRHRNEDERTKVASDLVTMSIKAYYSRSE